MLSQDAKITPSRPLHRDTRAGQEAIANGIGFNTLKRQQTVDEQMQERNYEGALLWMHEIAAAGDNISLSDPEEMFAYMVGWEIIRKYCQILAEQATHVAWEKVLSGYVLLSRDNQQLLDTHIDDAKCRKEMLTHLNKNAPNLLWPSISMRLLTNQQAQQILVARGIHTSCEISTSDLSSLSVVTQL